MERRLGRGLGSLLSDRDSSKESRPSSDQVELAQIQPNPYQPRRYFDPDGLEELAESIRVHGVLQPVVVRQVGSIFELIAGERRCRAARLAGLERVPAVVRQDVPDEKMLELALIENVQRRDLDPIERAIGYRQMTEQLGLTQEQVAQRVGLKRATVANHLRLLELPAPVQAALARDLFSMGHARALLGLGDPAERVALAARVAEEGLSVREVERLVRERSSPVPVSGPRTPTPDALSTPPSDAGADSGGEEAGEPESQVSQVEVPAWAKALETRLQEALGTRVEVRNRPGYRGQIVLHYFDRDDLERLMHHLAPQDQI